ncbi:Protein transport protein SEC23 [Nosema bombycis CQ1]|uniref:Protein transport protein SEC23 n=1 Tax=Nosema bombycis (strain CQ1 / CVCC 102059) TaxID=578461 RepID=R0KWM8_NOSB1|nr:Protein transport protein SEC23 [Nosema bombycis CQ1]|eukprot:EOB14632.1 Protein transport protein SEC23 [Nosema bombycis CQ1]
MTESDLLGMFGGTKGEETSKVPLACMYNIHQDTGLLECEPIFCSSCKSVLNFYCSIDYGRQSWLCVICNTSNDLPNHARDILLIISFLNYPKRIPQLSTSSQKKPFFLPCFSLLLIFVLLMKKDTISLKKPYVLLLIIFLMSV